MPMARQSRPNSPVEHPQRRPVDKEHLQQSAEYSALHYNDVYNELNQKKHIWPVNQLLAGSQ